MSVASQFTGNRDACRPRCRTRRKAVGQRRCRGDRACGEACHVPHNTKSGVTIWRSFPGRVGLNRLWHCLIRTEVRNDPRGEYPDWPVAAKDMLAAQKPKFVVMMIGLNDRKRIREVVQPVRGKPAVPAPEAIDPASRELDGAEPRPAPEGSAAAPEAPSPGGIKTYEFRSDAWSEAYIRRIDDTIAALKTAGVPIFWVGLPPLRGGRLAADIPFLNDLYRSRADKAGIVYVDIWDGFVDEDGRFAQSGPDFEGQTRRLRAGADPVVATMVCRAVFDPTRFKSFEISAAIGAAGPGRLGGAARGWIGRRRTPGAWSRWAIGVQSAAAFLRLQNFAVIADCHRVACGRGHRAGATLSHFVRIGLPWRRQQLHSAPQGQIGNGVANLVFYTSSIFRQSHVERSGAHGNPVMWGGAGESHSTKRH
jgi:lysophospholipase L1-like esterase